jgi:hypothetical protein
MDDFKLHRLHPCGKVLVGFFAVMVMVAMIWMALVGMMESGMIGDYAKDYIDLDESYEEYVEQQDYTADMNEIMSDDEAVTAPQWEDSGQEESIEPEDLDEFEAPDEEDISAFEVESTFWDQFKENMEWSLSHLSTQALLYLAVGLLFMMTTYSHKLKRFFFWLLGILIGLHVLGIAGYGFCWPGNLFTYIPGPIIIVLFFIMALMILINLGKKSS